MKPAWAALSVFLLLAAPVHGLTLLDDVREHEAERQLRLRVDEPPLRARAGPNLTLAEADPGPELSRIDVPLTDWRGFENTTTLNATGFGRLLLVDGDSGLVVSVEANASSEPSQGSPSEGDPQTQASSDGHAENASANDTSVQHAEEAGGDPGSGPGSSGEDRSSATPAASPTPGPRASASDEPAGADEGEGPLAEPAAIALALLAIGAFLVERFRAGGEDGDSP